MIKTQIQLEEWQYQAAKKAGAELGRSLSDLVREGVTLVLSRVSQRPSVPLESLAGKYEPIPLDDLKPHDRVWAETIG